MSNTITAYFKGRVGVAEALYQNDYGIVMQFDGIDLPAHFDCYFSVSGAEEAIPGVGSDSRVAIPNAVLANSGKVVVHIPLHSGTSDSEVEYVAYFRVIGRARPIDDGTPVQMTAIEQALALLQNPIENMEQIVNEALAFTGDTFAEMQEALDADQAAFQDDMGDRADAFETEIRGDISDVESDFDNLNAQFQTAVSAVTTDTEVTNIRVGADNVTYASAGEAVRTQFTNLKSDLNKITDCERITGFTSGYIVTSGATVDISAVQPHPTITHVVVDCTENDAFEITAEGGGSYFAWTFTDANYNVLTNSGPSANVIGKLVIAPSTARYLIINNKNQSASYKGLVFKHIKENIEELNDKVPTVTSDIQLFNPNDASLRIIGYTATSGYIEGNANTRICFAPCEPNKEYTLSILADCNRFGVFTTHELPTVGTAFYLKNSNSAYDLLHNGRKSLMFETDASDRYIGVFYFHASGATSEQEELWRNSLLINEGHIVFDYIPFYTTDIEKLKQDRDLSTEPLFGSEIVTTNVTLNDGWSGDNVNGFVHQAGYARPLVLHTSNLGDGEYILSLTSETSDPTLNSLFVVDVGGAKSGRMYEGDFTSHIYIRGFKAENSSNITISVYDTFVGTLKNISLKKIYSEAYPAHITSGNGVVEVHSEHNSVYMGANNANKALPSAENNVGVGVDALSETLSGYWNVAVGKEALKKNTLGSRNVAIGYIAMRENTNGHRNIAIGSFALLENTTGFHNIAIGADCLQRLTTGDNNIGLGVNTLANNNSSENVGVGYTALGNNTTGNKNVAVGSKAGNANTSGARNTLVGANADAVGAISDSVAVGYNAKATKNNQMMLGSTDITEVVMCGNKKIVFNNDGTITWESV